MTTPDTSRSAVERTIAKFDAALWHGTDHLDLAEIALAISQLRELLTRCEAAEAQRDEAVAEKVRWSKLLEELNVCFFEPGDYAQRFTRGAEAVNAFHRGKANENEVAPS